MADGPLFSQEITIPSTGVTRLSMVGGSPSGRGDMAKGYVLPPSYGILHLFSPHNAPEILQCTASVYGYQNHPVDAVSLPGAVTIDVPASVEIQGPPGTRILLQVWPTFATKTRGAKRSLFKAAGAGILSGPVPLWADVWDFGGGADVTFYRDSTLAVPTGFFVGSAPLIGMTVPSGSGFFQTANVAAALALMFRQQ